MSKPSSMNFGHQNYNHFMRGQPQQQFQRNFNTSPSTSSLDSPTMMLTNSSQSFTLSTDESTTKEETARDIFFRTLSASLKEANKFYSGKTTTWKNPFLYKTNLCDNYSNRLYCRYGVNCWYAHGPHELRCIPETEELPDPIFISQYLSFLGLPKQTLEQIIQYAYTVANLFSSTDNPQWFTSSKKSAATNDLPSFDSISSLSGPLSPNKKNIEKINNDKSDLPLIDSTKPINIIPKQPNNEKFLSSLTSNGGWGEIESALNDIVDENSGINENFDDKFCANSYRLFGDSCNSQKHW
uniref:C3H1-type domain-containing protein n=1 Tax=Panagrolaimus superbus TaxID=310955 RepID=A0A914Z622_9BILA